MTRSPVNQQLIADRLKISRTTVSRCFTNHPGIHPSTRAKVLSLATSLGYHYLEQRADPAPGSNRRACAKTIGVILCTREEAFQSAAYASPGVEMLSGISEFALRSKFQTHLHDLKSGEAFDSEACRNLLAETGGGWDGVLLLHPLPRVVLEELTRRLPCVSLVEQDARGSLDCVGVDYHRGVASVIDSLLHLRHRRIGFFASTPGTPSALTLRRYSAFMENLARHGMMVAPEDVIGILYPSSREESHRQAITQTRHGVTAWVCASDHQAYELINAFRQAGLRVPEDVSVAGFDGIRKPAGQPELTTVQVPFREIGATAARRLHERMLWRVGSAQSILLECRIRWGQTLARVPVPAVKVVRKAAHAQPLPLPRAILWG